MTSRHPAVSCACPKCQSERRTPHTPATDAREAVAGALLNTSQRRCKTPETPLSEIDEESARWYRQEADAALSTLAQIRAAEILAAEANERARIAAFYRANGAGSWDTFEAFARAIERNEHGAGK